MVKKEKEHHEQMLKELLFVDIFHKVSRAYAADSRVLGDISHDIAQQGLIVINNGYAEVTPIGKQWIAKIAVELKLTV